MTIVRVEEDKNTIESLFFQNCNTTNIELKLPNTNWIEKMNDIYSSKINNAFILSGNIYDYSIPNFLFEEYLTCKLIETFNIDNICFLDLLKINKQTNLKNQNIRCNFESRLNDSLSILCKASNNKKALILKYPEYIVPNELDSKMGDEMKRYLLSIHDTIMSDSFRTSNNILIIVTESKSKIHPHLLKYSTRVTHLEVPYPNNNSRLQMINFLLNKQNVPLKNIDNVNQLVNLTSGLRNIDIEDIWKLSSKRGNITIEAIDEIKIDTLSKEFGDLIEIANPNNKYRLDNFGGMTHIKDFIKNGIIEPVKNRRIECVPKGLLFMGSPGTGKTYLAKCIASESNISFVEIKLSKFLSKWVGESEHNLEKILSCINSLEPCFVFIDEIDQVLQRGDNDNNGVRSHIFQMILNYMSLNENRGKIIWIAATNYPNKIDEALKRTGRFDTKLVFTPPINIEEINEVLQAQINSITSNINIDVKINNDMLNSLNGYSQAEIECVVRKALSLALRDNSDTLNEHYINKAIKFIVKQSGEEIDNMIQIAVNECNDLEFLSDELINKYKK